MESEIEIAEGRTRAVEMERGETITESTRGGIKIC